MKDDYKIDSEAFRQNNAALMRGIKSQAPVYADDSGVETQHAINRQSKQAQQPYIQGRDVTDSNGYYVSPHEEDCYLADKLRAE